MAIDSKIDRSTPTGAPWELTASDWNTLWEQVQMARGENYGPVSDNATVLASGGSVALTLAEWMRQPGENVLSHGADPSGVADSSSAISAAIDALPVDGGTVFFPAGTYLVGELAPVCTRSNVRLLGVGAGSILKKAPSCTTPIIKFDTVSNVIVEALQFDGNKANQAVGDQARMGLALYDVNGAVVRDCIFTRTSHSGLYTRNTSQNVLITGCTLLDCGQDTGSVYPGVYIAGLGGVSRNIRIVGNHFENNRMAISCRGDAGTEIKQLLVSQNTVRDNEWQFSFAYTEEVNISDNIFHNAGAVRTQNQAFIVEGAHNSGWTVSRNQFTGTAVAGAISIGNSATNVIVSENVMAGVGSPAILLAGVVGATVAGNSARSPVGLFIQVDAASSEVVVHSNVSVSATSTGNIFVINGCSNVIVTSNVIKGGGSTGTAIVLNGTNVNGFDNVEQGFQFSYAYQMQALANSGATPNVATGTIFKVTNSSPQSVTDFVGGVTGRVITLVFGDANTTLVDGNLFLAGPYTNWNPPANSSITFVFDGNWKEIARSNNG